MIRVPAGRLSRIGEDPADPPALAARKSALIVASLVVGVIGLMWGAAYAALGLPTAALIPTGFAFVTFANLLVFSRTRRYGPAQRIQLALIVALPLPRPDHAAAVAAMALEMLEAVRGMGRPDLEIRIGIDTGSVIAGVIGRRKFAYDLWGDTVNTASRMESHGIPGRIQVTPAVEERLRDRFRFEPRGLLEVKGKGSLETFFLVGCIEQ